MTRGTLEDIAKESGAKLAAALDANIVTAISGANATATVASHNHSVSSARWASTLEKFEGEFEDKYKVRFEDFMEAMLEKHPELKI